MPAISTRTLLAAAALCATGCPPPRADLGTYTETETEDGDAEESGRTDGEGATASGDPGSGTSSDTGAPVDPSQTSGDPGTTAETGGEPTTGASDPTEDGATDTTGSGHDLLCGDGLRGPGEACDDGNPQTDDGCLPDCTLGPGGKLRTLELPPIGDEQLHCFTRVGSPFLGDSLDALVIGGDLPMFGPEGQWGAHVWHVPLPEGNPASWSFAQYAGVNGRLVLRVATAANGDVVVAGLVGPGDVEVPTDGNLWLARLTPAGGLLWSHELPAFPITTTDLLVTPAGNILLAGPCAGDCDGGTVAVFDPQGALLWRDDALQSTEPGSSYTGVAVDDASEVYVVGTRVGPGFHHLVLRAFAAEGGALWESEVASPLAPRFSPRDLVLTSDGRLVVAMAQFDADHHPLDALGLASFTTDGEPLWWNEWTAKDPGAAEPHRVVATPDGGFHVVGRLAQGGATAATLVTRFDADGDKVWANLGTGGFAGLDALLADDGLLYVLTAPKIDVYLP